MLLCQYCGGNIDDNDINDDEDLSEIDRERGCTNTRSSFIQ